MEWFKMRMIWGKSVKRLSDAEAGRFIKAIYEFMDDGKEYDGSGREELMIIQALETLRQDRDEFQMEEERQKEKKEKLSETRRQAVMKRWEKQKTDTNTDTNVIQKNTKDTNDTSCNFCNTNENLYDFVRQNKNKNKNKKEIYEEEEEKRAREEAPTYRGGLGSMLTDEDLQKGIEEQQAVDRIRATWEECGCRFSDRDEKTMHELLEKHTEEQIIKAVESAHDHNARGNWGYIKAILEGGNKGGRTGGTAQSRGCAPSYGLGNGEKPDWYPEEIG